MNTEIEARFAKLSRDDFSALVARMPTPVESVTMVIMAISGVKDSLRSFRSQTFSREGVKLTETINTKTRGERKHISDVMLMTVHESKETSRPYVPNELDMPPNPMIRIKKRYSVPLEKWRLDVTAVHSTTLEALTGFSGRARGQTDSITRIKRMIGVMWESPCDLATDYEMELEYDHATPLSLHQVAKAIQPPLTLFMSTYWIMMSDTWRNECFYSSVASLLERPMHIKHTLKTVSNAAIELNKSSFYKRCWQPVGYAITDKADGYRAFIVMTNNMIVQYSDTEPTIQILASRANAASSSLMFICDAEVIECRGSPGTTRLVFDAVFPTPKADFKQRQRIVDEAIVYAQTQFDYTILPMSGPGKFSRVESN